MKILMIGYFHGFGGAEKQLIMLSNEMVDRGHEVYLVSLCKDNICFDLDKRVNKFFINDKYHSLVRIAYRYKALKKVIKQIKPNIIINFWFQSAYLTALLPKKIRKKIIYSERGDPGDSEYKGLLGLIRKIVFKKIDGFVFQTSGARNYFNDEIVKRSIVIPNPLISKVDDYIPFNKRKNKIVCVGRLHKQKNIPLLINAFSNISSKYNDYILEIYGDGDERHNLEQIIKENKMSNKIFLKGSVKDIQKHINDSRLFILPSNYEGMPNALLEAMSLGLTCISTNWNPGGVTDIIDNKKNGLIVPKNNQEELEKAIKTFLDDDNLSEKCGLQAKKDSKKFDPQLIYDRWEVYLKKIINYE